MAGDQFGQGSRPDAPRILFVGLGESSHTHAWVDLLDGAGFDARLFAMPTGLPPDSWPVPTYVTAYTAEPLDPSTRARLHPTGLGPRIARRLAALARGRPEAERLQAEWLADIIRRWRPDIVHTFGIEPSAFFYLSVRERFDLRAAVWVMQARGGHDLALHRLLPEYAERIRAVMRECDWVVADNRQNYEYAVEMGASPERLCPLGVLPGTGGIDVGEFAGRWQGPPSERRVILWPKAYECPQGKALPVLEALRVAWERLPPCEVYMLAATPETRMWFQTLPEEMRRRFVVRARVPREEALEVMTRARVMLAPSLADGVPNTLYEAMASGAFPILSPLETIRSVVEEPGNVLFARNLYPEEVAAALTRAMTDDALVDAAAGRNLELVRRLADRAEIRPRVVDFYRSLLSH
jgi:glycosyltransferase involved in cell wall biosynthesis